MADPAASVRDVWFTYKPSGLKNRKLPPSLAGVSLRIRRGEVYGLLGPNGAGKTTLIKILSTLLLPDKGEVRVLGEPLPGGEAAVRNKLGLALAEYERTFHFRLTGRQNLRFFARFLDLPRAGLNERIDEVLGQVDLLDAGDKMFFGYSTGMKHRLAVARALLPRPELLVFDEPTAGLDAQTSRALGDLIRKLAQEEGATVVYTTHRLEEAGRLCDRVAILHRGKLLAEESPANLRRLASKVSAVTLRLDGHDATLQEAYRALPGVHAVYPAGVADLRLHVDEIPDVLEPALAIATKHGRRVLGIASSEPSFEDVFLELTQRADPPPADGAGKPDPVEFQVVKARAA